MQFLTLQLRILDLHRSSMALLRLMLAVWARTRLSTTRFILKHTVYTTLSPNTQNNLGTDPFNAPGLLDAVTLLARSL